MARPANVQAVQDFSAIDMAIDGSMEEGVVTKVWNYVFLHLTMFNTAVVICWFNYLIALAGQVWLQ